MSVTLRTTSGTHGQGLDPHDRGCGTPTEIPSHRHASTVAPAFPRDIPLELLEKILYHLDLHSILKSRSVCCAFRELVDSSPNLQYKMELARAGMEDGDLYSLATRRIMLEQHERGWAELQWTNKQQMSKTGGNRYELYGNVLAQDTPDRSAIHFKKLQSKSRNIEGKDWSVDIREYRMQDFGIDPAQDLLVIVEPPRWEWNDSHYRVSLRKLTGEPHPSVKETNVLTHERQQRVDDTPHCRIYTCGDILAILFDDRNTENTEVVIWNWKTGQVLLNIIGGINVITSMMFLSERHVMLGIIRTSVVATESTLVAIDFIAESPGTRRVGELQNAFIFRFPPLMENARIIYINIRSYPSPTWKPSSVPFFTARHDRLCVITLYAGMPIIQVINLFALGDVFLSLIKNVCRNPAYFDWHTWGPDGTRIVTSPFIATFSYDVYGTRYAWTMQPRAEHLYIYDFNQLALIWAKKNGETDVANTETDFVPEIAEGDDEESSEMSMPYVNVTKPTTLTGGVIFQDDIETRLGYRVKRLIIPREPRVAVLCSEDGIVIKSGDSVEEYHALTV